MANSIRVCALIPAAGRGVRFGSNENKVFAPLLGRPLLAWTIDAFARSAAVDTLLLVGSESDLPRLREIGAQYGGGKLAAVVLGGSDRQESVRRGLAALPEGTTHVVVHDGARPCVTPETIDACVDAARRHGAAYAVVPVTDTLVRARDGEDQADIVPRDDLFRVQTPQAFAVPLLVDAHAAAERDGARGTDDAGLLGLIGHPVRRVAGSPENLKVTQSDDLAHAEAILARRDRPAPAGAAAVMAPPFRIGFGYDVHPFADGRPLYLGGVHFPDAPRGLLGHSDADVLLHAVCDALLGAAGLGDIGKLFPPSDMRHKDRRSTEFLAEVAARLRDAGWAVGNVDVMVLAEAPRIGPRSGEMREIVAAALGIAPDAVSIKATTNEGLGFVGRGEGIAVQATALIMQAASAPPNRKGAAAM